MTTTAISNSGDSLSYTVKNGEMSPILFEDEQNEKHEFGSECAGTPLKLIKRKIVQPLTSWWGKRFGIGPSERVTSRRSKKYSGTGTIQNYDEIVAECKSSGELWQDPMFPANDGSLFYSRRPPKPLEWKRPSEISKNPQFISAGASRFDVQQGDLGDCWLLAAVANLTLYPQIFENVVLPHQNFDQDDKYCGVFRFKFWRFNHWIEVLVDDRLPTFEDRLVYMHSADNHEFWSALLEKAYAKLCGSYEALKGGTTSEAMEDFTGGVAEVFDLVENPPKNLFRILRKSAERHSLISCSIDADPNVYEKKMTCGLVCGHAYSVTAVKHADLQLSGGIQGEMKLVRVRNPWGGAVEWNGPWSDTSPEWTCISAEDRKNMGLVFEADGEFWMSMHDFLKYMQKVEICHLGPQAADAVNQTFDEESDKKSWKVQTFDGKWTKGATAGGCRNYLDTPPRTFPYNPQYTITLSELSDNNDNKCTCIIALMQKNRRRLRQHGIADYLTIGFAVFKLDHESQLDEMGGTLNRQFFKTHVSVARTQSFINVREVCCRFTLPTGTYVVVPSTFAPEQEGEFLLRVFSETECDLTRCAEKTHYEPPTKPIISPLKPAIDDSASDRLDQFFERLAGQDFELDAWELQKVLTFAFKKEFDFDEFGLDTCRSMIACVDLSRSGKLDVEEFKDLWRIIRQWKAAFIRHDHDKSGRISSYELRDVLKEVGYHLHPRVITALVLRYSSQDGQIKFDDFIGCAVKLKTMMDIFEERDPRGTGTAKFPMDAWVELVMYA